MFGCAASKTVNAETNMVEEIVATMENRFNKDTLRLEIPRTFENIKLDHEKIEIASSSTLQPLNLVFGHNVITDTIGYIFVNTGSKGLRYKNAVERGNYAKLMLEGILKFKEVELFIDLSKDEIIEKL